jgi:hypothetical protein
MVEETEDVKAELRGSVEFVIGVLVFGACLFSVLVNLCFLAVNNDIALKRAYLLVANAESVSPSELRNAIVTIDELLLEDARLGGRPVLCEDDAALIDLYPKLKGEDKARLAELLARKTGVTANWKFQYLEYLPTALSPFRMPFLELILLYYGWVIEIATIIFLSQSLRKPHVQEVLYDAVRKPRYFLPAVSLMLYVPAWHWATLVYPRSAGMLLAAGIMTCCLLAAWLLLRVALVTLNPAKMNELGFHLLISSLFIQLLTVMGDPDVVYVVFSAPRMHLLKYGTWFIILCYPGLLFEKWYHATRDLRRAALAEQEAELESPPAVESQNDPEPQE